MLFMVDLILLLSRHKYMIHILAYRYVNIWRAQKDMSALAFCTPIKIIDDTFNYKLYYSTCIYNSKL